MKRLLPVLLATGALLFAACGDDSGSSSATTAGGGAATTGAAAATTAAGGAATTAAGGEASGNIQKPGECGMGTGEKATGEPIKIGAIATNVPGIDFTWITEHGQGLLRLRERQRRHQRPPDRVHRRGGADRPAADRRRSRRSSIEQDEVLGIVGNTSIIDCSVNGQYYAEQGFYPIIAGVDQACFTTARTSRP